MRSRPASPVPRRRARSDLRPSARRPTAWLPAAVLAALLVAGLVTACTGPPPSDGPGALPAPPDGVTAPAEYAFGDDVAARDLRAWGPVYDALATEVDEERLRTVPLVLDTGVDVTEVRDAYDGELAGDRRWEPLSAQPGAGAWAQGWTSPDGDDALVLVGLEPRSGETHVPLTVVTTLPDEASG